MIYAVQGTAHLMRRYAGEQVGQCLRRTIQGLLCTATRTPFLMKRPDSRRCCAIRRARVQPGAHKVHSGCVRHRAYDSTQVRDCQPQVTAGDAAARAAVTDCADCEDAFIVTVRVPSPAADAPATPAADAEAPGSAAAAQQGQGSDGGEEGWRALRMRVHLGYPQQRPPVLLFGGVPTGAQDPIKVPTATLAARLLWYMLDRTLRILGWPGTCMALEGVQGFS